jgi:hypothetical protein
MGNITGNTGMSGDTFDEAVQLGGADAKEAPPCNEEQPFIIFDITTKWHEKWVSESQPPAGQ